MMVQRITGGTCITFDLSALKDVQVHRAHVGVFGPVRRGVSKDAVVLFVLSEPWSKGQEPKVADARPVLRPPRYKSFEVTEVIRKWLTEPSSNHGFMLKDGGTVDPRNVYLEIAHEGAPAVSGGVKT